MKFIAVEKDAVVINRESRMNESSIWIVIPAYDEQESIHHVLSELCSLPYRIVVVDDGSRDSTAVSTLKHSVTLLRHAANLGQGAALQTGIQYALSHPNTQVIVTFDADGQHDPADIPALIAPILSGEMDVCLGTRFGQGQALYLPFTRKFMLKIAVWFTRMTTHLPLTDTHNGFRAFSRSAAEMVRIRANRMAHASEILQQIYQKKLRYQEVPVTIRYSAYSLAKGQSLFEFINILWDLVSGGIR